MKVNDTKPVSMTEAKEILSNSDKRRTYDSWLKSGGVRPAGIIKITPEIYKLIKEKTIK